MSGTSCDGLDVCYTSFTKENNTWRYEILSTECFSYNLYWLNKLKTVHLKTPEEVNQIDQDFASLSGDIVNQFIKKNKINKAKITAIASHGHTVFHRPEEFFTLQIGNGKIIREVTGIPTIFDFRSKDVSLGGQGAPLVPIGDEFLFCEYDYCLNIGGIANFSYNDNGVRLARDICFVNMIINRLASLLNLPYDKNGNIAKKGKINFRLLNLLLELDFNNDSLAIEKYEQTIKPILDKIDDSIENKITTVTEYAAIKIADQLIKGKTLLTGGGAHNNYLVSRIKNLSKSNIIIPSKEIIEFKEALVFGFLGVLFLRNEPNCLASVTGALQDNTGGVISK